MVGGELDGMVDGELDGMVGGELNGAAKNQLAQQAYELCRQAAVAIMSIYEAKSPLAVEYKADQSPLTVADQQAHLIIADGLASLTPQWPVLSEEQALPSYEERSQWARYWLVDPLDGTREFIDRNGEFTVNIALIEQGFPVLGVVYVPSQHCGYIGIDGGSAQARAWRQDESGRETLQVNTVNSAGALRLLSSARTSGPELMACMEGLAEHFDPVQWLRAGSALKFCQLAEGRADIYPRFSPCCEWDTAAGQAVLEAAGGQLLDTRFERFRYNQRASIICPSFYALGAASFHWPDVL